MSRWSPDYTEVVARGFLNQIRLGLASRTMDQSKLPRWVTKARIRAGFIRETALIIFFDDPGPTDVFEFVGQYEADIALITNTTDFAPSTAFSERPDGNSASSMSSASLPPNQKLSTLVLGEGQVLFVPKPPAFRRSAFAIIDMVFTRRTPPIDMTTHVPWMTFIDEENVRGGESFPWILQSTLSRLHDVYDAVILAERQDPARTFQRCKDSLVVVLGSHRDDGERELRDVAAALNAHGLDARLILDLPDIPEMSLEQKVRLWVNAARFCVMVDRSPSGHIIEYGICREARAILALLRPHGLGSTFMIGDDHLVDANFIRLFSFAGSPQSAVPDFLPWTDDVINLRATMYNAAYPWRATSPTTAVR